MSSLSKMTEMHHTGFPTAAYSSGTPLPHLSTPGQLQCRDGRTLEALDLSGLMQRSLPEEESSLREQLQNALHEQQIALQLLEDAHNRIKAYQFLIFHQEKRYDKAINELAEVHKNLKYVTSDLKACQIEKQRLLQCRRGTVPSVSLRGENSE